MTATETLRKLLDERGVEHSDFASAYRESTRWKDQRGRIVEHQLRKDADFGDTGIVRNLTPEQAIAATLGAGECEDEGGTDANGEQVFSCSECGCVLSLYDSDGVNTLCTRFVHDYPRFCPQCGRKVKR